MNEKFITDMRESVKALMEAEPYYFDIPVLTEKLKDIQGRLDQILVRGGGICFLFVTPSLGGAMPNVPGANWSAIKFVGRVLVNNILNKTGKEALDVAIYTAAFWSEIKPDSLSSKLRPDEPSVGLSNDPNYPKNWVSYDVAYLTEGGTKIDIPQLSDLTIDASNLGAIALAQSAPQPGAVVFYTLNNTQPSPRNPASALFLAPFSSTSGITVRARAWLPGYLPSAELRSVLP